MKQDTPVFCSKTVGKTRLQGAAKATIRSLRHQGSLSKTPRRSNYRNEFRPFCFVLEVLPSTFLGNQWERLSLHRATALPKVQTITERLHESRTTQKPIRISSELQRSKAVLAWCLLLFAKYGFCWFQFLFF